MRRFKKVIATSVFLIMTGCSSNYHTVRQNETLYSISVKNKISVNEIMDLNNMSTAKVYPGQKLVVKGEGKSSSGNRTSSSYHTVKDGETLYQISNRYNISVNNLKKYNNLNNNNISVGQRIYLKGGMAAKQTTPSSRTTSPTLRSFRKPLKSISVNSRYGTRVHPVTKKRTTHHGVDLKAAMNTPVYAPYEGVVTYSGWMNGYGKIIIIDHGGGYTTRYAHLNRWIVNKGTTVKKGQLIAKTGNTGLSTGPHLHYEIRKNGSSIDPTGTL